MTKTFIINKGQKSTNEQLQEVMEAKKHPIVFDDIIISSPRFLLMYPHQYYPMQTPSTE